MRSKTIIISVIIHVLVFGAALSYSQKKPSRRIATAVIAAAKAKPKVEEKKPEKPKPPKPKVEAQKPEAAKTDLPPMKSSSPVEAAAPVDATNVEMSNSDGPGIDVGGPAKPGSAQGQAAQGQAAQQGQQAPRKRDKNERSAKEGEDDNCTEAPTKPAPAQQPTDIEYTQEARSNGVEGRLILKIYVGADGSVTKVEVVSSVDPALDAAAIAAVKTWTFKPAMRCGKPMGGAVYTLARRFELGD